MLLQRHGSLSERALALEDFGFQPFAAEHLHKAIEAKHHIRAKAVFQSRFSEPACCVQNADFLTATGEYFIASLDIPKATYLLQNLVFTQKLAISSSCSGSDVVIDATRGLLEAVKNMLPEPRHRDCVAKLQHSWSCELDDAKRKSLVARPPADRAEQIFPD